MSNTDLHSKKASRHNREEGLRGEDMAIKTLKRKGYRIIERNFRSRLGEIDVIAEEGGCLVFVEVKKRNTGLFGDALCSIDETKKRHLVRCALFYLKTHDGFDRSIRFDVIGIDSEQIKLVKNAFLVEEHE
ncbi:MAG: YraN family protein [Syntrophorhabdales bacterium]|jgi:putative endonuclease